MFELLTQSKKNSKSGAESVKNCVKISVQFLDLIKSRLSKFSSSLIDGAFNLPNLESTYQTLKNKGKVYAFCHMDEKAREKNSYVTSFTDFSQNKSSLNLKSSAADSKKRFNTPDNESAAIMKDEKFIIELNKVIDW